jgi:hypothetical protein
MMFAIHAYLYLLSAAALLLSVRALYGRRD